MRLHPYAPAQARELVEGILNAPAIIRPPEAMRMCELMERDYYAWVRDVFPAYSLLQPDGKPCENDAPPPSLDRILREAFSNEQLVLAQRTMKRPIFTLAPVTAFVRLLAAMRTYVAASLDVSPACRNYLEHRETKRGVSRQISRYQLAIDEVSHAPDAEPALPDDNSVASQLSVWWEKNYSRGLTVLSPYRYLLHQMREMKCGSPLDVGCTCSLLMEGDSGIFGAGLVEGRLGIGRFDLEHSDPSMRLRPSIVNDVALIG